MYKIIDVTKAQSPTIKLFRKPNVGFIYEQGGKGMVCETEMYKRFRKNVAVLLLQRTFGWVCTLVHAEEGRLWRYRHECELLQMRA